MLHRCAVVNLLLSKRQQRPVNCLPESLFTRLDAVLPSRRNHFAAVKLKRRQAVVVLDRLKDPSRAEVPNLFFLVSSEKKMGANQRTRIDLSKLPLTT